MFFRVHVHDDKVAFTGKRGKSHRRAGSTWNRIFIIHSQWGGTGGVKGGGLVIR